MEGGGWVGGIFSAGRLAVSQRKSGGNSIHRSSWDRNTRDNYLRSLLQILISRNPFPPLVPPPYANERGIFSAGRRGVKKIFARHSPCLCFSRRCIKFRVAGRLACKLHLYFILFWLVFKSTLSFRSLEPAGLDTNITVIEKYYRRHLRWNYWPHALVFSLFFFVFSFFFSFFFCFVSVRGCACHKSMNRYTQCTINRCIGCVGIISANETFPEKHVKLF